MFISVGRLGSTACKTVSSKTFDTSKWKPVRDGIESPYYDAVCKCWAQGYRPDQLYLQGLHGKTPPFSDPVYQAGKAWPVCVPQPATASCPVCKTWPTVTCPTCKACPTCPPTPSCPTCPTLPSTTPVVPTSPNDSGKSAYGPVLGILLGVAVIGGGGYYAYKKGAFKGGKKR